MRDFRDAKAMAQTLREALAAKAITISHSESLELVSKILGAADWNTLSAMLRSERREAPGPTLIPAIPMRDLVAFPTMTLPIFVGRERTKQALDQAYERQRDIVIATQRDSNVDEPSLADVYDIGVLARVLERAREPDGTFVILIQASRRVRIKRFVGEAGAFSAEIEEIAEGPALDAADFVQKALDALERFETRVGLKRLPETVQALRQVRDPGQLADALAQRLPIPLSERQALLATLDPAARLEQVITLMDKEPEAAPV